MAKQDVLDAINATIVPNNIKGITAESLNNVLTMMVENAGEGGSGEGALRVIVPEMMMFGPEFISIGEFSPTSWEELKSNFEQIIGVDASEYDAVVKASIEHNANVAQQIIEKGKAGQGVSVVLDQTPYFPAGMNISFQMAPEMAAALEDLAMCGVQPAGLLMKYVKPTPEGEAMWEEDVFSCMLAPAGNMDLKGKGLANYPSNMLIQLNLDGSLRFTPIEEEQPSSGSGPLKLWYSPVVELTEKQINDNKASYNEVRNGGAIDSIYYIAEEGVIGYPRLLMTGSEGGIVAVVAADIVIGPNGEVTAETIDLELSEDGTVTLI